MTDACIQCSEKEEAFLVCSQCQKVQCIKCSLPKLKEKKQKYLREFAEAINEVSTVFSFCCHVCAAKNSDMETRISEVVESKVTEQISGLAKQLEALKQDIGSFTEAFGASESAPTDSNQPGKPSFAAVLSRNLQNQAPTIVYSDVKEAVSSCMKDEYHKRSVVVVGVPELQNNTSAAKEAQNTDSEIRVILDEIGLQHVTPEETHRMRRGKGVDPSEPRKIKVLLASHGCQQLIVQSKGALSRSKKTSFHGIFIRESQSKEDRNAGFLLRETSRRMNQDLLGEDWKNKIMPDGGSALQKFGIRGARIFQFTRNDVAAKWPKWGILVEETAYPALNLEGEEHQ